MDTHNRRDAGNFCPTFRLLIVDDHDTIREALRYVFSAVGVDQVTEAATSAEAIAAVQSQTFELACIDISLGEESGIDTLRTIKTLSPSLPVLMHTIHDSAALLHRSHLAGACGYLQKGVNTKVLLDAVDRAASGEDVWTTDQLETIQAAERLSSETRSVTVAGRSTTPAPFTCARR